MKTAMVKAMISAAGVILGTLCLWHSSGAQEVAGAREAAAGARPPADAKKARAKELYDERCARCHGGDGRGTTRLGLMLEAPDFTDDDWWDDGVSDKRLETSIAEGKDEMPAYGKKLTKSEIASLVAYVRDFAPAGGDGKR